MTASYRPSGLIDWLLSKLPNHQWGFWGCIGTEERSLAAWQSLSQRGLIGLLHMERISDQPSKRHASQIKQNLEARTTTFQAEGGDVSKVIDHHLTETTHAQIVSAIDEFLDSAGESVVLDVTSLPKRFFFPALKRVIQRRTVKNILITYTLPEHYVNDEKLAENHNDWAPLPLFSGDYKAPNPEMYVVGIGFEELGLLDQLKQEERGMAIKLLFPFPAPPAAFRRSWSLVHKIEHNRREGAAQIYQVNAREISDSFDRIVALTDGGNLRAVLAPFGPKPISIAMCLFATLTESAVYYTQPTVYHPNYSMGVGTIDGKPAVYSYLVRYAGHDYFSMP